MRAAYATVTAECEMACRGEADPEEVLDRAAELLAGAADRALAFTSRRNRAKDFGREAGFWATMRRGEVAARPAPEPEEDMSNLNM